MINLDYSGDKVAIFSIYEGSMNMIQTTRPQEACGLNVKVSG